MQCFRLHSPYGKLVSTRKNPSNGYNNQLLSAKKVTYHLLLKTNSSKHWNLWKTVNNPLHPASSHPLPNPSAHTSFADSFASFLTDLPYSTSQNPSLDKELLSIHRPISNLYFLSKLFERVVLSRLNSYLSSNNIPNQSAYTKHPSTETVLTLLYSANNMAIDRQKVSCLCFWSSLLPSIQ